MNIIPISRIFLFACSLIACANSIAADERSESILAPTPPMGWNSFDSYGTYAHEQACYENLETFVEVFKPLGYEYFVIDGGWYIEYELHPGTLIPTTNKGYDVRMNENGYFVPSKTYFPNGLKGIADECHKNGVKLGVHFLRGIPRKAYELDTPIVGTSYTARDIANPDSICAWNPHIYGIDMSKPGAQEYYDGWIQLLADMGVDFIKVDDIVTHPSEIAGVVKAIENVGRPIVLSLSPGDRVLGTEIDLYQKADMMRVTSDVWDTQHDLDECFDAWLTWQYIPVQKGFWLDMDMIPFGELQVMSPEWTQVKLAGEGKQRFDRFTVPQKESFMAMRALSASPLMMGGRLSTLDDVSLRLLTNQQMIACNQNGKMGHLVTNRQYIQIWITEEQDTENDDGWIGVFNRSGEPNVAQVTVERLGLNPSKSYQFYDIWGDRTLALDDHEIDPRGCLFIRYEEKR